VKIIPEQSRKGDRVNVIRSNKPEIELQQISLFAQWKKTYEKSSGVARGEADRPW